LLSRVVRSRTSVRRGACYHRAAARDAMEDVMSEDIPEFPTLNVHGGAIDGYEMKLSPGMSVIIGSGRLAQMRLDHPDIELAHIKVIWDDQGIQMMDNGSRKGTWVNGEPVETVSLMDGDTIEFVGPTSKATPPKVQIRIPKGSVPEPPPPPPPTPEELAARTAAAPVRARAAGGKGRGGARRRGKGRQLPDLRVVGLAVGALLFVVGVWWLTNRLFFTVPQVESVSPASAEPGQTVTVTGKRFRGVAADNLVWFGDRSVPATSVSGGTLQVTVPPLYRSGAVALVVETGAGRSHATPFVALLPLQAVSLDPAGALPGDGVTLAGTGFADGVTVAVGGASARVVSVEAGAVHFEMPAVAGSPGSRHDVVATMGARRTRPLPLYLGRVPLVVSFEPARGVLGDIVRVHGAGFAANADDNVVTFDGVPALVLASRSTEMAVVLPPPAHPQPETLAQVVVHAGGKASSEGAAFPIQQLVEGTWVPRFYAGAIVEGGAKAQATVGTAIAPVLMLSGKDDARTVGERALHVAAALNALVDRARVGQPAAFEAREEPEPGVGLVGAPDIVVRVTPHDAAAYDAPPGLPGRGAPPTPMALAAHWAALLNDTFVVGTSGGRPTAAAGITPAAGAAFAQLRAALPWQYGSGVSCARVVALPPELKRRLREAALRVP
jgi:hypothetical protein